METKQKSGAASGRRGRPTAERNSRPAQKKSRENRRPVPEVAYTPPKPVNRGRIILGLATAVAVVAAITFAVSIFFKVETVNVSGTDRYTPWQVLEASGIRKGESLMAMNKSRAAGNIRAALPYVKSVRIGRALPDTVNIEIVEEEVTYCIGANGGGWWLITAEGRVVEKIDGATAGDYTMIKGVTIEKPAAGMAAVAAEVTVENRENEGDTETAAPVTVTAADRLNTVLRILKSLEENRVIGGIVSVDVTDMGRIELWYGDQYQVKLGDQNRIEEKIYSMAAAIGQLEEYQSGVIDVSFTVWPDEVGYTPFT